MILESRRWLNCCVLALLMFTQAVTAWAACVSVTATARDAFAVMPADCDMPPAQANANLCLMQCLAGDQNDGDGRIALPSPPDMPVRRVAQNEVVAMPCAMRHRRPPRLCAGPPLSVLCRLRL